MFLLVRLYVLHGIMFIQVLVHRSVVSELMTEPVGRSTELPVVFIAEEEN